MPPPNVCALYKRKKNSFHVFLTRWLDLELIAWVNLEMLKEVSSSLRTKFNIGASIIQHKVIDISLWSLRTILLCCFHVPEILDISVTVFTCMYQKIHLHSFTLDRLRLHCYLRLLLHRYLSLETTMAPNSIKESALYVVHGYYYTFVQQGVDMWDSRSSVRCYVQHVHFNVF